MKPLISGALFAIVGIAALPAQSITGLWDASLQASPNLSIPFPLDLKVQGHEVKGTLFNGDEEVPSTAGTFDGTHLIVEFGDFDAKIEATYANGELKGIFGGSRGQPHTLEAHPHVSTQDGTAAGPTISGNWTIPHESPKGEKAWHLIVRQNGPVLSAAILRVDGDTGTLRGSWHQDHYALSIFDGGRGSTLELTPQADGSLQLVLRGLHGPESKLVAYRDAEAIAKGLPKPTDPEEQTRLKNPSEPVRFAFPDLDGNQVTNTDERFKGKVVLLNITGSWCPNCHDEAPFLASLFDKYHDRGLEVVALDFEDAAQQKSLSRVKAFRKKFGIHYPYLIAGEPKELPAKVPQAVSLNSFPTTFIIGRDGLVRSIHAGYPGRGSAEFYTHTNEELTKTVESLLAEKTL